MPVTHLNDQDFDQSLNNFEGTVLIDFWAPWCAPCRAMSGIVDDVAGELGESANVVKANVDESPSAAEKFGVQSIPTFVDVQDGSEPATVLADLGRWSRVCHWKYLCSVQHVR